MKRIVFFILATMTLLAQGQQNEIINVLNRANAALENKDFATAADGYREAVKMGADIPQVRDMLGKVIVMQAQQEFTQGDNDKALALIQEARTYSQDPQLNFFEGIIHQSRALKLSSNRCYDEAEAACRRALSLATSHDDSVRVQSTLAVVYMKRGAELHRDNAADWQQWLKRACEVAPKEDKTHRMAHSQLGTRYGLEVSRQEIAGAPGERLLELSRLARHYDSIAGKRQQVAESLIKEAEIHHAMHNDRQAFSALDEALKECNLGNLGATRGQATLVRGKIEYDQHDFRNAITHLEEAYALTRDEAPIHAFSAANTLNRLFTHDIKDPQKADYWLEMAANAYQNKEALDNIQQGTLLEDRRTHIQAIESLIDKNNPSQAEAVLTQLIAKAENQEGYPAAHLSSYYKTLAHACLKQQRPQEAVRHATQAVTLLEEAHEMKDLAQSYEMLAIAHYHAHDTAAAAAAAQRGMEAALEFYGDDDTRTQEACESYANYQAFNNNAAEALRGKALSFNIVKKNIKRNFSYLTSEERSAYWAKYEPGSRAMFTFAHMLGDRQSGFTDVLYNRQLLAKGLLLTTESELRRTVDAHPALKQKMEQIKALHTKAHASKSRAEQMKARLEADRLERDMGDDASKVRDFVSFLEVEVQDVRKGLKKNEAAIEFADYRVGKDSVMYAALVLRPEDAHPRMVPLFEARQLSATRQFDAMSALVWEPLMEHLRGVDAIYFSPSGALYGIPVESFPVPGNDKLMSERYRMFRLSSTRELAKRQPQEPLRGEAAVFGGMDYYAGTPLEKKTAQGQQRSGVANLEYSQAEAEAIVATIHDARARQKCSLAPVARIGGQATKTMFRQLGGHGDALLHVCTHGFFYNNDDKGFKVLGIDDSRMSDEQKALVRNGLLFSGANMRLLMGETPASGDDGILTAQEVAHMDLKSVQFVVLSACQTGRGQISGDGVFGLQRGFKKAGARSMLMTLSNVYDKSSATLMEEFYKAWLLDGMTKREALEHAKSVVRAQHPDPAYWAPFILLDALD